MTLYQFTPQASDDLLEIWRYIAAGHPDAADRVETAIYAACTLVAQSPPLQVIRILHGMRDVKRILKP